ncbi:hypothetical protein GBF38_000161 [Nibea albiflora]|nr:hypothetical protein GBF38_000161 [Nibea albiflora]
MPKSSPPESRCAGRACNPRMGNLAQGRVLSTQSVCGSNSSEPFASTNRLLSPASGSPASVLNAASATQHPQPGAPSLRHERLLFPLP